VVRDDPGFWMRRPEPRAPHLSSANGPPPEGALSEQDGGDDTQGIGDVNFNSEFASSINIAEKGGWNCIAAKPMGNGPE